jgi:subtilisin family serine protease
MTSCCKAVFAAILVLLITAPLPLAADAPLFRTASAWHPGYKEGELLVKFKTRGNAKRVHKSVGAAVMGSIGMIAVDHVAIPAGMTVSEALALYRNNPDVAYAEPNYYVRKASIPDDPLYTSQWNLPLVAAPAAWSRYTGRRDAGSVIVAVLDTGIAYTHPDITANLWTNQAEIPGDGIDNDGNGINDDYYGANFGGLKPGDPWDDDTADSHGTHVAGIIGATGNNGVGTAGINWTARIMAVKVLHGPEGYGELSDVLKGMEYALARGAKIINCSIESTQDQADANGMQSLHEAVKIADQAGAIVVSAAGNTGLDLDTSAIYPASIRLPNNIAVAAVTRFDELATYSDSGRHSVDLVAPGGSAGGTGTPDGILSTVWLANGSQLYRTTSGTSMAAPHVTGAAALAWNLNPGLSAYQVKGRILNSVDRLPAYAPFCISGGRLNLDALLTTGDRPAVFNVTPYRLQAGTAITVSGVNFGPAAGQLTVGSKSAAVTSWSDTAITAVAPAGSNGELLLVNGSGSGFPLLFPVLPTIAIIANPATGSLQNSTVFELSVVPADAVIVKYEWDFGSGAFEPLSSSVSHTFTAAGKYLVRGRVTDDLGRIVETALHYTVAAPGSGSGSGGCFIATAAYGSYLHPKVRLLREFRDRHLLTNRPGRAFVTFYYRHSPKVASLISGNETLQLVTRWLLTPMVAAIEYPLLALLPGVLLLYRGFRRRVMKSAPTVN